MSASRKAVGLVAALLLTGCASPPSAMTAQPVATAVAVAVPNAPVTPADTAQPGSTTVAAETPVAPAAPAAVPTPCPSSALQTRASDICVRPVMDLGPGYIRLRVDPVSGGLFALSSQATVVEIVNGAAQTRYTGAQIGGGEYTLGMAFGPDGTLYVVGNATRGTEQKCTVRRGVGSGGGPRVWSTVVETEWFPLSGTQYDHRCNGIVISPDNQWLYVNSGSRTEHGEVADNGGAYPGLREVPLSSAVFRVPVSAQGLVLSADPNLLKPYLFADGLRNAFDLAIGPGGELFAVENGPDADYPEELNVLRPGGHYGFPWQFGDQDNPTRRADYDPARDPLLSRDFVAVQRGMYQPDPGFPPPPAAMTVPILNTGPAAHQSRNPDGSVRVGELRTFTPHRSPLGLNFDTASQLGGAYAGAGFVVSWGSAGGTLSDRGNDLLMLRMTPAGDSYTMVTTQLVTGFSRPIDATLSGRTLYVLDFEGRGTIWALDFP
jgi:glucose/arabinose dehydrogenase